jgi:predicted double-glycine peptidase
MKKWVFLLSLFVSSIATATYDCRGLTRNFPRHAQIADFTCGVTCVRSLLQYYFGIDYGEVWLAQQLGAYELGFAAPDRIQQFLLRFGLYSKRVGNIDINDLRSYMRNGESLLLGISLHGTPHYVLVKAIESDRIVLMDPWIARENHDNIYSLEEFKKVWVTQFGDLTVHAGTLRIGPRLFID